MANLVFQASSIKYVLLLANTPDRVNGACQVMRKYGLSVREQDKLLRQFAPYFRLTRRR